MYDQFMKLGEIIAKVKSLIVSAIVDNKKETVRRISDVEKNLVIKIESLSAKVDKLENRQLQAVDSCMADAIREIKGILPKGSEKSAGTKTADALEDLLNNLQ